MKVPAPMLGVRRLFAVFLVSILGACGGDAPEPVPAEPRPGAPTALRLQLLEQLPIALEEREVARIEFGEASARPHLEEGWGEDERDDVRGYVWGLGERSTLSFFAVDSVPIDLVFENRSFPFPGDEAQTVRVELNGHPLGETQVEVDFETYRFSASADKVRVGRNELAFHYGRHHRPGEDVEGARDDRPLAVLWYTLELRGLEGGESTAQLDDAGRLLLPKGHRLSYFLDLHGDEELALGRPEALDGDAHLRVEVEDLEGRNLLSQSFDPKAGLPPPIPLPASKHPVRLALSATRPEGESPSPHWLRRLQGWMGAEPTSLRLPLAVVLGQENSADGTHSTKVLEASGAENPYPIQGPRHVLIYLIDTLRADHLGLYGYDRPTSPRIDRFGEEATVFTFGRAQTSWTRTAVASLFTGLQPQVHGVNRRDEALAGSVETLAELLTEEGYRSAGFITNGNVSEGFGLAQGFESYEYLREANEHWSFHQLADRVNAKVFPWLDEYVASDDGRPFFLYVHTTDPHGPYTPPEPFYSQFAAGVDRSLGQVANVHDISAGRKAAEDGTREAWIDLYDGEIAFNDHHFGLLLDHLRKLGLYESTLIVLLSDHGEEFFEHGGWEHGKTLYEEQLHIPFVVKLPSAKGRKAPGAGLRVDFPAHQIDVLPTVLNALGLDVPPDLDGRSLLPFFGPENPNLLPEPSFAYLKLGVHHQESSLHQDYKLIRDLADDRGGQSQELFHLAEDPGEQMDLDTKAPVPAGYLRQTLETLHRDLKLRARGISPEKAEMSDELRERLEALGYVN